MLIKTSRDVGRADCVFNRRHECSALTRMLCRNGGACPLYKTEADVQRDHEKTVERLCSLPEEKQTEIADRLFAGNRPWKGEGTWDTRAV